MVKEEMQYTAKEHQELPFQYINFISKTKKRNTIRLLLQNVGPPYHLLAHADLIRSSLDAVDISISAPN